MRQDVGKHVVDGVAVAVALFGLRGSVAVGIGVDGSVDGVAVTLLGLQKG